MTGIKIGVASHLKKKKKKKKKKKERKKETKKEDVALTCLVREAQKTK